MDDSPGIPAGLCDLVIVSPASGWFWLDVAAAGSVQDEGWRAGRSTYTLGGLMVCQGVFCS